MLEDPGVLESVLACFPSLKHLSLKDNFIPQLATEDIMRRVAPHLLLAPPTTTSSGSHTLTTAGDHRRHPLLALPSSSTAAAVAAAASTPQGSWSCAASPASSPSRSSPPGIDDEEAEIASPLPRKRRAPAAATTINTTTSKATPMATSPCYTPSPATAYVGRRDPAASSGPTTPTRPRSSAASSAFAAAAASFSGTQRPQSKVKPSSTCPLPHTHITKPNNIKTGPVPTPGPASTHPRRPISYAERLLLSDPSLAFSSHHKTPHAGGAGMGSGMGAPLARLSPLERAMREEEEDGEGEGEGEAMDGVKGLLGLGLAGVMLDEDAYGGANALPLSPLTNANPPPKRARRDVGNETAEEAVAGAGGVGGTQQLSFAEEGH